MSNPMMDDFKSDGPMTEILRRLAALEKFVRDHQNRAAGGIEYMTGTGRTLQMVEVNGSWADYLMHTLTGTWPTAFSSLDTAWFISWCGTTANVGQVAFSANVATAQVDVRGQNDITEIVYVRFFGIGVL